MSTVKYAVVAGHNKIIPGASGSGYKEHEVARQVVARVLHYFSLIGEAAYNCTDDEGRTKEQVWMNAVRKTNQNIGSGGLAISIHLNSASNVATGTEVLHYNSPVLADKVSDAVAEVLGITSRGAKNGKGIGYISETKSTAILIELCFINNPADMDKLMSKIDAVAIAIVETVTGKKVPAPAPVEKKEAAPSLPPGIIGQVRVIADNLFAVVKADQTGIEVVRLEKGRVYNVTQNTADYHKVILDDTRQVWVHGSNGHNLELAR